jgi:hypothetical protein
MVILARDGLPKDLIMRWTLFALLFLAASASAETWRWVDEDGVVNFSDQPRPGAERVELKDVSTYTPPTWTDPSSGAGSPSEAAAGAPGESPYRRLEIIAPANEETIWNAEGTLDVALAVEPPVRSGDRVSLYLDGQRVTGLPADATRFTINRVFRGMHTLRATVEGSGGAELASSATTQFFVRQTSVVNPQRNNPAIGPLPSLPPGQTGQPRPQPRSPTGGSR